MTLMGSHEVSPIPRGALGVAPGECDAYACSHTGTVNEMVRTGDTNWLPLLEASVSFSWG